MNFFSERLWACQEVFSSFLHDRKVVSLTICLSSLALTIPVFITTILYSLSAPLIALPTQAEITVFLTDSANPSTAMKMVQAKTIVTHVELIKKAEALQKLNTRLGIKNLDKFDNPLPDILVLTLSQHSSSQQIDDLLTELNHHDLIAMTAFDDGWRQKLRAISQATTVTVITIGGIVTLLLALVLLTVIRLTTKSVTPIMKSMYLFGASPLMALRPWVWRGITILVLSSLLSLAITYGGLTLLQPYMTELANLYKINLILQLPPADWCLSFVLVCGLIGGVTSWLSAYSIWKKSSTHIF